MSSTRRGCTKDCYYSTSPASACTCACGGEHHGHGAQASGPVTGEIQTVGGQSFIPVAGSDSKPAEHAPEQQAGRGGPSRRLRTDDQLRHLLDREQQRATTYHDQPDYDRQIAIAETHHEAGRYTDADMERLRGMVDERRPAAPSQSLDGTLLGMDSGDRLDLTVNGEPYTVYWDAQDARGDNGYRVPGDQTGTYEVFHGSAVESPVGLKAVARIHVGPHGSSGYGNPAARRHGVDQVIAALQQRG